MHVNLGAAVLMDQAPGFGIRVSRGEPEGDKVVAASVTTGTREMDREGRTREKGREFGTHGYTFLRLRGFEIELACPQRELGLWIRGIRDGTSVGPRYAYVRACAPACGESSRISVTSVTSLFLLDMFCGPGHQTTPFN